MLHANALVKTPEGWKFSAEINLEDFIWNHLELLIGLKPLKRQYIVQAERCDILALSESGQLVILELKNVEDRYVVQQLTRYYHNLLTEKPLTAFIDYNQPVQLVAIAPTFHRHNYIDRLHSKLPIKFFQFEIIQTNKQLTFHLKDLEGAIVTSQPIEYSQDYIVDEADSLPLDTRLVLPSIPRVFEKTLLERHLNEKEMVLKIREKIMSFDERMAEVSTSVVTRYGFKQGNGEIPITKLCAELYSCSFNKGAWFVLNFSLWLPIPNRRYISQGTYQKKIEKVKLQILTDNDPVSNLGILKNPKPLAIHSVSYYLSSNQYLKFYKLMTGQSIDSCSLDNLIEIALSEWRERVDGQN